MNKFPLSVCVAGVLAASAAVFGQGQEETEEEPPPSQSYLPAWVYPALSIYGGVARGPSYDAAPDISGRAAAIGLNEPLDDFGTLSAFGVAFDFFIGPYLATSLKITQEQARRRHTALKYDYSTFPKMAPLVTEPVLIEERISYGFQNVDYKIALKYVAFPHWPLTPYAAAGVGGNLALMDIDDQVSNAILHKGKGGALLTTGWFQQFSFDWVFYAGLQINVGDNLFFITEYNYDHQFHEHEFAGYKYRTGLDGFYAGAGWRFR